MPQDSSDTVVIACANCAQKLRVKTSFVGRLSRCPKCRAQFQLARSAGGSLAVVAVIDDRHPPPAALAPVARPPMPPVARRVEPPAEAPGYGPPLRSAWEGEDDIRPAPFFAGRDIVIDCPWCDDRLRLSPRHCNRDSRCPACGNGIHVAVSRRGYIDIECPNCLVEMEVPERLAGRRTRCIRRACGFGPLYVPDSPIEVERTESKAQLAAKSKAQSDAVLGGIILLGAVLGARHHVPAPICPGCGLRRVMNPSGYCHVCRGRL